MENVSQIKHKIVELKWGYKARIDPAMTKEALKNAQKMILKGIVHVILNAQALIRKVISYRFIMNYDYLVHLKIFILYS